MSNQEVILEIPGEKEAIIKFMDENGIEYKNIHGWIRIKNCLIALSKGLYEELYFETDDAKKYQGKPIVKGVTAGNLRYGDVYLPFQEQQRIFNQLKRVSQKYKAEFYKRTEEKYVSKKESRDKKLKELKSVIDFERNVLLEEHKLEDQLKKTIKFIENLLVDIPKLAGTEGETNLDPLFSHISELKDVLVYLQAEEIETIHILKDTQQPIQMTKQKKQVKILKKHLKKLSVILNWWVKEIKAFLKYIRLLPVTPEMKRHLKEFYTELLQIYTWYAQLFKKEAKRK